MWPAVNILTVRSPRHSFSRMSTEEAHGARPRRTGWWLASTLLVVLASAAFVLLQWPAKGARGAEVTGGAVGRQIPFEAHALSPSCPVGAAIPSTAYDLGEIFEGLAVTSKEQVCNAPPQGAPIESGPTKPVGYLDVSYGECSNPQGDGCSPPVDVQSWPECAATRTLTANQQKPVRVWL